MKQIIGELDKPDNDKVIKPVGVGGIAGGEKFITQQLFLKFAKDSVELNLCNFFSWIGSWLTFHNLTSDCRWWR